MTKGGGRNGEKLSTTEVRSHEDVILPALKKERHHAHFVVKK